MGGVYGGVERGGGAELLSKASSLSRANGSPPIGPSHRNPLLLDSLPFQAPFLLPSRRRRRRRRPARLPAALLTPSRTLSHTPSPGELTPFERKEWLVS